MIPEFDHTGAFIWAAYGFAGVVIAGLIVLTLVRAGRAKARLEALEKEDQS